MNTPEARDGQWPPIPGRRDGPNVYQQEHRAGRAHQPEITNGDLLRLIRVTGEQLRTLHRRVEDSTDLLSAERLSTDLLISAGRRVQFVLLEAVKAIQKAYDQGTGASPVTNPLDNPPDPAAATEQEEDQC